MNFFYKQLNRRRCEAMPIFFVAPNLIQKLTAFQNSLLYLQR
jgi:hypothetical protein